MTLRLIGGKYKEKNTAWDCGYAGLNSRMQYTGTGFSKPLKIVFKILYRPSRKLELRGESAYHPEKMEYITSSESIFEKYIYRPIFTKSKISFSLHKIADTDREHSQLSALHFYCRPGVDDLSSLCVRKGKTDESNHIFANPNCRDPAYGATRKRNYRKDQSPYPKERVRLSCSFTTIYTSWLERLLWFRRPLLGFIELRLIWSLQRRLLLRSWFGFDFYCPQQLAGRYHFTGFYSCIGTIFHDACGA